MTEPNISVKILTEKEIGFDLYGEYLFLDTNKKMSGKFKAKFNDDKIKIIRDTKELITAKEILFFPEDVESESFLIRDVIIGKNFHWERKEKQRFRGSLKFIIEGESISAINILSLEEYLTSVISSEMNANCSEELLKTHAIVSRGWLLAQLEKRNKKAVNEIINEDEIIRWYDREDHINYDFCADDHCQRYQGISKIVNDNALRAIEKTRGLVLIYNNMICDARYSKCCGGITETFENVWEPVVYPYLSSINDSKYELDGYERDLTNELSFKRWVESSPTSFCNTSDKKILSQILVDFDQETNDFFRWKVEYTQNDISGIIKLKTGIDFGKIKELVPLQRGKSGRIIKLKIIGTNKSMIIGKELEIRRILSPAHLYSSAFIVSSENVLDDIPQRFVFHGGGWGHGVGLCQIGAAVMGEIGYNFDEILLHYFCGARIQRVY